MSPADVSPAVADASRQASRAPVQTQARVLTSGLGSTLVAFMAGVKARGMSLRWASGEAVPRDAAAARLLLAYTAWTAISTSDGPATARNWFIGANPWLGALSPAQAIREDDKRVLFAVQALLETRGGA